MMNKEFLKEFVPYEVALRLKALGFDEPCFGYYNSNGEFTFFADLRNCTNNSEFKFYPTAPTFSQAFRWFRENYGFHIRFLEPYNNLATPDNKWRSSIHNMNRLFHGYTNGRYIVGDSYEEAELACLEKVLEIIESKIE